MWFTLGIALLGLWFVASSITPILRNLSVMYVFRPELINSEGVRSLRVGLDPTEPSNTALLTATYTSPLRARLGAAERER